MTAHLVALHTVEALRGTAQSAEDVAAADDDAYLHAHLVDFLNLSCIRSEPFGVDAVALFAHQTLAAELQENSFESCHSCWFVICYIMYVTSLNAYSRVSPWRSRKCKWPVGLTPTISASNAPSLSL